MALTRANEFDTGTVLTEVKLEGEFDNIYNNALSLISPLTGNLAAGGNIVTGLGLGAVGSPSLQFTGDANTGVYSSGADALDLAAGGLDILRVTSTPAAGVVNIDPGAISATASTNVGRVNIDNTAALTIPAGTTPIAASLFVGEPNLTATGTITSAATVYIEAAPTEATNNYALWTDAGRVRFDGAGVLLTTTPTSGIVDIDSDAITATANTNVGRVNVAATSALTIPAGTTPVAATLFLTEPNLTATGTVTNAATLYVGGQPTEGGTGNYSIWVDAGTTRLDGSLDLQGGQIAFPATQSASADVNTLDDYEEGTWTPAIGGTATYTAQVGRYTKIGRLVWISFDIRINLVGTGSTTVMTGAPFTQSGITRDSGSVCYYNAIAANEIFLNAWISGANISFSGSAASSANITDIIAVFGNSTILIGSITYIV